MKKNNREITAILRGINPSNALKVVNILTKNGISKIEIPLNSTKPFETIKKIKLECENVKSLGAGTVLKPKDVELAHKAGCNFIFSPNLNKQIIKETKKRKMVSVPGVFSPSEAINAIEYGADALKLFPAHLIKPEGVKSLIAVLPKKIPLIVVGGFERFSFKLWLDNGVTGFGIGSYLYNKEYSLDKIDRLSKKIVKEYDKLK
jgi:2-dehydro-3-deoxyphosphogalactonate aldolase